MRAKKESQNGYNFVEWLVEFNHAVNVVMGLRRDMSRHKAHTLCGCYAQELFM